MAKQRRDKLTKQLKELDRELHPKDFDDEITFTEFRSLVVRDVNKVYDADLYCRLHIPKLVSTIDNLCANGWKELSTSSKLESMSPKNFVIAVKRSTAEKVMTFIYPYIREFQETRQRLFPESKVHVTVPAKIQCPKCGFLGQVDTGYCEECGSYLNR